MMRGSSPATTTRAAPDAAARWATRTTIGSPAMSARGLSGRRVEASRAGIRTTNAVFNSEAQLFVGKCPRFRFEQHRNAIADRICEAGAARDQFLLFGVP